MAWREALLGLILVIVAYMVWLIWRMRALNRKNAPPIREFREPSVIRTREAQNHSALLNAYRSVAEEGVEPGATPTSGHEADTESTQKPKRRPHHARPPTPVSEEKEAEPDPPLWTPNDATNLAQQAFMTGVEREMAQIQDEVDSVRGALAVLREDLALLREEFQQHRLAFRTAQNASPLYKDAMQMAILGHDALTISERCGISRAEADLVTALVKNRQPDGKPSGLRNPA